MNPEHIPITIKRLKDEKLLDDRQFAQAFIQTRLQTSSKGPVLIQNELRAKGVSEHICQDVLSIYSYDKQYEKALKWAEKRSASGKKQSHQMQIQQLRGSLIRKGFTQDVIQDVIRDIQHHKDDEVEWKPL
ncbi:RecX family transcriptional regulator [Paracerasibacillus soli]|uniref:Regulatory protein RecX n=1 Tax=Paracerasibacillus soli TaxID=480284 RepID=A0ABU5CMI5_9BACI|nr:RecX family transcriptional regulator [Virgibacillus soli]MDY0407551.1 RecX family transcriptional regulator [Virgibacillus soli]